LLFGYGRKLDGIRLSAALIEEGIRTGKLVRTPLNGGFQAETGNVVVVNDIANYLG
jgi:hypothetical protein